MDITAIIVIVLCIAFIIGGLFLAKFGDKQSREISMQTKHNTSEDDENKK